MILKEIMIIQVPHNNEIISEINSLQFHCSNIFTDQRALYTIKNHHTHRQSTTHMILQFMFTPVLFEVLNRH